MPTPSQLRSNYPAPLPLSLSDLSISLFDKVFTTTRDGWLAIRALALEWCFTRALHVSWSDLYMNSNILTNNDFHHTNDDSSALTRLILSILYNFSNRRIIIYDLSWLRKMKKATKL